MVAEDDGDDEEGDTQEGGNASDQVDKVMDFLSNGSVASVQAGCQASDASHDSVVTARNDNAFGCSLNSISGEERQVFRFQWILVCVLGCARLWLRLTSQRWVVNLNEDERWFRMSKWWWWDRMCAIINNTKTFSLNYVTEYEVIDFLRYVSSETLQKWQSDNRVRHKLFSESSPLPTFRVQLWIVIA